MLDHLVYGALRASVLLGLALAAMPLLRNSSAATRRLLLVLALAGALVIPVASIVAPAWRVPTPLAMPVPHGHEVPEPLIEGGALAPRAPVVDELRPAAPSAPRARLDPAPLIGGVWALGVLLVALRLAVGLARSSSMARRAAPSRGWSRTLARAERALGVRGGVRESGDVDVPAVTGVLRPVVLVPPASSSWSEERRYAVLLHELAHVRQRDCLAHIVAQLACAVHWFNPLAWLAARRLRIERELAADDAVITAGARASTYAEDLLAIAGAATEMRAPEGALGMGEPSRLAARVTAVLSATRARRPLGRVGASLVVVASAMVAALVACATPDESLPVAPASRTTSSPMATGQTTRTTIDPKLQAIAEEELDRVMAEWQPASGVVLMLEPSTGEIRASAGRAHGVASDVAVRDAYVPGSTLKLVTLTGALDDGVVSPTDSFDCEHGAWTYDGKVLHDSHSNGTLALPELIAVSSNVGIAKMYDRLGGDRLEHWLRAFHFGVAPPIPGANPGSPLPRIANKSFSGALAAIGEALSASPLQVAAAYAAIANGGVYVPPTLSPREGPAPRETIMKPETARVVTTILEGVVSEERGTGKLARIDGTRVAGKTGTAAFDLPGGGEGIYASFVGFVPSVAPRFVILVGIEQPKGDDGNGPTAAAPAFARVASRALAVR
jgi:beta-lactamase regulating signal transducer with metallopeptidase domain